MPTKRNVDHKTPNNPPKIINGFNMNKSSKWKIMRIEVNEALLYKISRIYIYNIKLIKIKMDLKAASKVGELRDHEL